MNNKVMLKPERVKDEIYLSTKYQNSTPVRSHFLKNAYIHARRLAPQVRKKRTSQTQIFFKIFVLQ